MHRLESKFSFTASNAFKMDKWHALFALKKHHPLNWSLEEYMDMMNLSIKWSVSVVASYVLIFVTYINFVIPLSCFSF